MKLLIGSRAINFWLSDFHIKEDTDRELVSGGVCARCRFPLVHFEAPCIICDGY